MCRGSPRKFPHLQESDCYTVNLPISASIGNKCVKGPCQDTIGALWACNVRPSIGTHRTMGALEGKNIITMLIRCQSLSALENLGSNTDGQSSNRKCPYKAGH